MKQSGASMTDGLSKMLGQLAQMATFPDADLDFLTKLQMAITQYLRSSGGQGPMDPNAQQGQPGQPGMPPGAPPSNVPPPSATPGAPGGMAGGGMMGMGMPNPDELRRMLGANANQGG